MINKKYFLLRIGLMAFFLLMGPFTIIYKLPNTNVDWILVWFSSVVCVIVPLLLFPLKSKNRDTTKQKWRSPDWSANPFNWINDPVQSWHAGAWNIAAMGLSSGIYSIFFSPDDVVIAALEVMIATGILTGIKMWQIVFPSTVDDL